MIWQNFFLFLSVSLVSLSVVTYSVLYHNALDQQGQISLLDNMTFGNTSIVNIGTGGEGTYKSGLDWANLIETSNVASSLDLNSNILPALTDTGISSGAYESIDISLTGRVTAGSNLNLNLIETINGISSLAFELNGGLNIQTSMTTVSMKDAVIFQNAMISNEAVLGTITSCTQPFDSGCVNISGLSCPSGGLMASCLPASLSFNNLFVTNLAVLNQEEYMGELGDQENFFVDMLYVNNTTFQDTSSISCTQPISQDCFSIEGSTCTTPLELSCMPTSDVFSHLDITDTLVLNGDIMCLGGGLNESCVDYNGKTCSMILDDSCVPPLIKSINGIVGENPVITGTGLISITSLQIDTLAELNTAVNVGTMGQGVFSQKLEEILIFYGLGSGIAVDVVLDEPNNTLIYTMANSGVVAGQYIAPTITTDVKGRIISATGLPVSAVTASQLGPSELGQNFAFSRFVTSTSTFSMDFSENKIVDGAPDNGVTTDNYWVGALIDFTAEITINLETSTEIGIIRMLNSKNGPSNNIGTRLYRVGISSDNIAYTIIGSGEMTENDITTWYTHVFNNTFIQYIRFYADSRWNLALGLAELEAYNNNNETLGDTSLFKSGVDFRNISSTTLEISVDAVNSNILVDLPLTGVVSGSYGNPDNVLIPTVTQKGLLSNENQTRVTRKMAPYIVSGRVDTGLVQGTNITFTQEVYINTFSPTAWDGTFLTVEEDGHYFISLAGSCTHTGVDSQSVIIFLNGVGKTPSFNGLLHSFGGATYYLVLPLTVGDIVSFFLETKELTDSFYLKIYCLDCEQ